MKILMVTSSYPLFPGDVTAPFIESIARGLVSRGHAVDVVLPHHPRLQRPKDDSVRFFPYRYAPDAWSVWGYAQSLAADVRVRRGMYLLAPMVAFALRRSVARRLRAEPYDVVHAHWVVPNAAFVASVARSHKRPFVVSLHGSDVFLAERLLPARIFAQRAFVTAGSVTACSADLRDRALALGAQPARSHVVPYGVDPEAFRPREGGVAASEGTPDRQALRSRLGMRQGERLVLAFGRLVEKKGFAHLVEAAAGLSGVRVAIAGAGDLQEALTAKAAALTAPVTLPGALDRRDMAEALTLADVVAVPSVVDSAGNVDGLPNALLEALAAGCAVVASRVAGIPEVIEDGVNGLLVPEKDPRALRAALDRLLGDGALRGRLGAAARARAVRELGWDTAARRFEECYAEAATLHAR